MLNATSVNFSTTRRTSILRETWRSFTKEALEEGGEKRSFGETFDHGFRPTTTELQGSGMVIGSLTHGNGSPTT
jgi:hypothetical protein